MKLIRLKLGERFRSLPEGCEIHFLRDWDRARALDFSPYCLAGRNGSGKSNILEALAAIFYHVECVYLDFKPDGFERSEENPDGFDDATGTPDVFELEYYIIPRAEDGQKLPRNPGNESMARILMRKERGKQPEIHWLNREEFYNGDDRTLLERIEVKRILPEFVVGYSSGENEILSLPFFKMRFIHYDEYHARLSKQLNYDKPEGRLIYLDNQFSQAILLCNFLLQSEKVLKPFQEEIGLEDIREFRIVIHREWKIRLDDEYLMTIPETHSEDELEKKVELTSYLTAAIDKLKKCSTAHFNDPKTGNLILDYCVNEETKKAFRMHYGEGNALELFRTFQILLTLNLYHVSPRMKSKIYRSKTLFIQQDVPLPPDEERIMRFKNLRLKKKGIEEVLYSRSLSDGEHQLLHSIGLCLLFRETNTLFLLDEPETHFNPDWRAKFISTLRDCLDHDLTMGPVLRDLLITSHSPFIISDCRQENVLVFTKDENGCVECKRPDFETFGASANQITIRIFGKKETIGDLARAELENLYRRWREGEDADTLIQESGRLLGDSIEKVIFINRLSDGAEE